MLTDKDHSSSAPNFAFFQTTSADRYALPEVREKIFAPIDLLPEFAPALS